MKFYKIGHSVLYVMIGKSRKVELLLAPLQVPKFSIL